MLLLDRVTDAHKSEIQALLSLYQNGTKSDKIAATMRLAIYVNQTRIGIDTICPTCPNAERLMTWALSQYAQVQKALTNKRAKKNVEEVIEPMASDSPNDEIPQP